VDEFLKSAEQRELNLDEMEQVTGGTEPTITVNGQTMTKTQFNNLVFAMFDEVGHDAAFNLFTIYTGYNGAYSGAEQNWKHCWQSTGQQSKAVSNILITVSFGKDRMN